MTATIVLMIEMRTMTSTTKSIAMMTFIAGGIPNPSWSATLDFPLFKNKLFSEWKLNEWIWNKFSRISELVQKRQRSPWLWYDALYYLMPSGREHSKCLKILHDFTNKVSTIPNSVALNFFKQEVPVWEGQGSSCLTVEQTRDFVGPISVAATQSAFSLLGNRRTNRWKSSEKSGTTGEPGRKREWWGSCV